jgi:hypothetical protein
MVPCGVDKGRKCGCRFPRLSKSLIAQLSDPHSSTAHHPDTTCMGTSLAQSLHHLYRPCYWGAEHKFLGGRAQVIGGQSASYWGAECKLLVGRVQVVGGQSASYWGAECKLLGGRVQVIGGQSASYWGAEYKLLGDRVQVIGGQSASLYLADNYLLRFPRKRPSLQRASCSSQTGIGSSMCTGYSPQPLLHRGRDRDSQATCLGCT